MSDNNICQLYDFDNKMPSPPIEKKSPVVLKAYFAYKKETLRYKEEVKYETYKIVKGDNPSKIARKRSKKMEGKSPGEIMGLFKELNGESFGKCKINKVIQVPYQERAKEIDFIPTKKVLIDEGIYLVVKTDGFSEGNKIKVNIRGGGANAVIVKADANLKVDHNGTLATDIIIEVGTFKKEGKLEVLNIEDYKDYAITKISLRPYVHIKGDGDDGKKLINDWVKKIADKADKKAYLYLYVDGHTDNELEPGENIAYCANQKDTMDTKENKWYYGDGKWFEMLGVPPWLITAKRQLGQKEDEGKDEKGKEKINPMIIEYFEAAGRPRSMVKDDGGGKNAWCAAFIGWVMEQHGGNLPNHAIGAAYWRHFGEKIGIENPMVGAIGFKKRSKGGHVSFLYGKSEDEEFYYMLGGNQDDSVNISKYKKSVWKNFMIPEGFKKSGYELPVYVGSSVDAGSEE